MPFVRLIIPLIAGIIIEFYGGYALPKLFALLIFSAIGLARSEEQRLNSSHG